MQSKSVFHKALNLTSLPLLRKWACCNPAARVLPFKRDLQTPGDGGGGKTLITSMEREGGTVPKDNLEATGASLASPVKI